MSKPNPEKPVRPEQHQDRQPGVESEMKPRPISEKSETRGSGKLKDQVAVITGGDSGIGKAAALALAKEGADIAILYLNEHDDASKTQSLIQKEHGRRCITIPVDLGTEQACVDAIHTVIEYFGQLNIIINNAAEQHPQKSLLDISAEQLEKTFRTNIFAYFYLTKAALPYLIEGSTIINTASVTAFRGSAELLDYSATKGAIVAFTRSLALSLAKKKIRVNGVAPGPVWTPLIPSTFEPEKVAKFGSDVPMERAGEPAEIAPCYVFLASSDSSYMTGQFLHPNGGEIINT